MTDKAHHYRAVCEFFADHGTVAHERDEYVRGHVHTNTVEGFYSIKRGMKDVISIAAKSICTAIWRNLIFATRTALRVV
jgi:hypothetical protein